MKALERLQLIESIGLELQKRMTFADIDVYLRAYGVDVSKATTNSNSKRIYVKNLLGEESEANVMTIAEELGLITQSDVGTGLPLTTPVEATFWSPSHFKLFISHLSDFKKKAGQLQIALKRYGISAFVAHEDIEPSKEWLSEIEAGLTTMEALAAILMPGFKESNWTDQEVGFAVGRGVLILPIIKGLLPYGFIAKYQGLHADGKTVNQVAESVFQVLVTSKKTKTRMLECLIETTLQSLTVEEALDKLLQIESLKAIPIHNLERLREGAPASSVLSSGKALTALNKLLKKYNINRVKSNDAWGDFVDDIPF